MELIRMLGALISIYQEIIKSLDDSLDIVLQISSDDEDIINEIKSVREINISRLQQAQELIDTLTEKYQIEFLSSDISNIKH